MKSLSANVEVSYLYHFHRPYKHARHYCGSTRNWSQRDQQHRSGQGSPLVKAALDAGISVELVWLQLGRKIEREIKRSHNAARYCPVCQESES